MSDLVSRQAAIDKINERQRKLIYRFGFENDAVKIMDIAKSIIIAISPSQPEIIRCKDCKHWRDDHTCREHSLVSSMRANEFCSRAERRTDG